MFYEGKQINNIDSTCEIILDILFVGRKPNNNINQYEYPAEADLHGK